MEYFKDLLAALSVILNGLPQGLLALSFGFASVPTALAFVVGAVGNTLLGNVAPISFQAETITLAGTMGNNLKERLSMIFFAGLVMTVIGAFGVLERIIDFVGPVIINGMMAGVGIMLTRVAVEMSRKNNIVGFSSIAIGFTTYMATKDLVYTIAISVILSSVVHLLIKKHKEKVAMERERFIFQKPILNYNVARGAMALTVLTIGANIAFGKITGSIANAHVNVDHLSLISGIADMVSSIFGGGPVESIISATGSAPNPVLSGVMMMGLMAVILFAGLLPKIGRYIPGESISGFLFVLGAIVTVPINAGMALSSGEAGGTVIGGLTMTVTAITDPFIGMVAGIIVKFFIGILGM